MPLWISQTLQLAAVVHYSRFMFGHTVNLPPTSDRWQLTGTGDLRFAAALRYRFCVSSLDIAL
ncbi:MAG: hypothetical protein M3O33_20795 [Cyanobacteriota bacterium]|nr:hypothetical protein [Cyanobacteriota bacterium]